MDWRGECFLMAGVFGFALVQKHRYGGCCGVFDFDHPGVSLGDKFSAFRNCNAELEGQINIFRRWPE